MLECIDSIEAYCAAGDMESDERTLDAVLRKLQILTESSKRVSEELKAAHAGVAWRELAGFRNVVVHDYLGIRVERVGGIVKEDIPRLREQIAAYWRVWVGPNRNKSSDGGRGTLTLFSGAGKSPEGARCTTPARR